MQDKARRDQIREEQNRQDREWLVQQMKRENPKILLRIGVCLDVFAILTILLSMLFLNRFWALCSIFCCAASVYLAVKHPGYFSLVEDGKARQERCGMDAFFLILPYWVPVNTAAIGFGMRYGFSGWGWVLVWAAVITAAVGVLLWFLIPELRRRRQHMLLAFGLALFISFGAVFTVNYGFGSRQSEKTTAVVTETSPGGGKSSPSVTVKLPDGETVKIPVHYNQYLNYQAGGSADVMCYKGSLGIAFFEIP